MASDRKRHVQFRQLLAGPGTEMVMECHSGISAVVARESGFKALWGSGLTISSCLGLRDSNEATWSEALEILGYVTDAVDIPILFDGDTGFGNFNNFRRLVDRLGRADVSGVTIEDKIFPKMNSFVGNRHTLAPIDEMCGKIRAGKDRLPFDEFAIIARTEALISNCGQDEALRRADAYFKAGADAIFIHSRAPGPEEILEFSRRWDRRCPLVVAPTTFYKTPIEVFQDAGVTLMICANHSLRASIAAMRSIHKQILSDRGLAGTEQQIVALDDLFKMLRYDELAEAEMLYLPGQ